MKIAIPENIEFQSFDKISRVNKSLGCIISEKIDGTNAQIVIQDNQIVAVGSRSRWIVPGKTTDNYGFAGWVEEHYDELLKLGEGTHFGEWYGNGIQRNYGLKEKRFALFNSGRWTDAYQARLAGYENDFPNCVQVVPILYQGDFSKDAVDATMDALKLTGSRLVPGFDNPEGIVVYLTGPRILLKDTYEFRNGKWAGE